MYTTIQVGNTKTTCLTLLFDALCSGSSCGLHRCLDRRAQRSHVSLILFHFYWASYPYFQFNVMQFEVEARILSTFSALPALGVGKLPSTIPFIFCFLGILITVQNYWGREGDATYEWNLKCVHSKTEFDLTSFPFIEKPITIVQNMEKHYILITFIFCHRAVVKIDHYMVHLLRYLSKFRFLMHAFRDLPLCMCTSGAEYCSSSTSRYKRVLKAGVTVSSFIAKRRHNFNILQGPALYLSHSLLPRFDCNEVAEDHIEYCAHLLHRLPVIEQDKVFKAFSTLLSWKTTVRKYRKKRV